MYFNDHTLSGNVGRDAVLRDTKSGKVLSFSVAHTSPFGEKKTTWYDVSVWGKRAESLEPLIKKGTAVVLRGESGPDSYTDKSGDEKFKMTFRANDVQIERGGSGAGASADTDDEDENDEDLPF